MSTNLESADWRGILHEGRNHMKLPTGTKALIIVALVATWFIAPAARSVRADGGTLTTTTPVLTYTHGPFFVPNPSDQVGPPSVHHRNTLR